MMQPDKGLRTSVQRRNAFLTALARGLSVTRAAEAAAIGRGTVYSWRKTNKKFAAEWALAEKSGTDLMEDEAVRRALEGVERPVYRGGQVVGHVTDYSDTMLMFLLKARRPEKFKDGSREFPQELDLKGARDALISKFAEVASVPAATELSGKPDRSGSVGPVT